MTDGSAGMCMAIHPAPVSAATGHRVAEMSLMMVAPAVTAARATAALRVSMETRAPLAASASTTGNTRRSSSASGTGRAPGRVDSPPTSMMSAPSAISAGHARLPLRHQATAPVGERVRRHIQHAHHAGHRR